MGGGVVVGERAIARGGEHPAVAHEHRAHRHFAPSGRGAGLIEGQAHRIGRHRALVHPRIPLVGRLCYHGA